ncbi:NADH dehydrogenase [ubiquinone] iron-sulfur protein 6, mitochondrial [Spea bombifrons]|uniref:NADH dehydrogenase [ubiquinone] iron-sulfur protein 6, mitochondrial n=1 Tax=Spea bombifrons TaxID=233779 RepID=UPI00234B163B|nr:NADH dehydrogenase [ubiquinone] iron-sulfur protein 6, mitochondrial [Spea bombifrons]
MRKLRFHWPANQSGVECLEPSVEQAEVTLKMAAPSSVLVRVCTRGFGWKGGVSPCLYSSLGRDSARGWRAYTAPTYSTGEKITHTGQVFDEHDYRKVRFVGRQKEVNEQFAINLISEQPVTVTESRVVSCDGGGGALGHPKVYINLDKETKTGTCGYCGLQFRQNHHH